MIENFDSHCHLPVYSMYGAREARVHRTKDHLNAILYALVDNSIFNMTLSHCFYAEIHCRIIPNR